jgi:hypothetical protein
MSWVSSEFHNSDVTFGPSLGIGKFITEFSVEVIDKQNQWETSVPGENLRVVWAEFSTLI